MSTENSPQVWRVECDDAVREVTVTRDGACWYADVPEMAVEPQPGPTPRQAVAGFAGVWRWPVVGVLAPGQPTRAELEARNADLSRDRDTALAAALDLAADRDATRAILEGRATPPTDAEIDAHERVGGVWIIDHAEGPAFARFREDARLWQRGYPGKARRWLPIDRDGRPCAWPVVEVSRGA